MNRQRHIVALLLIGGLVGFAGCSIGPKHWATATDILTVSAADLDELRIDTHNGKITVIGRDDDREDIQVTVKRKGGGETVASAEACLEAIEIVSEDAGDNAHQLGWRLDGLKESDWHIQVSFDVTMPRRMAARATTHNGGVKIAGIGDTYVKTHNGGVVVDGVSGACDVVTHNGGVKVVADGSPVRARSYNGGIYAACGSGDVELESHNGAITLDTRDATRLAGDVRTYNGGIRVKIGEASSTTFDCNTHNGRIDCGPCDERDRDKRSATCVAGAGEQHVSVTTHNGGIRIDG